MLNQTELPLGSLTVRNSVGSIEYFCDFLQRMPARLWEEEPCDCKKERQETADCYSKSACEQEPKPYRRSTYTRCSSAIQYSPVRLG
jgi:hypothetical protein